MKYLFSFLTLFIVIIFSETIRGNEWPLQPDSMNCAILIVDYETYEFEGGHFSNHISCSTCTLDSLPFSVQEHPAIDFGDVTFIYNANSDTLFFATIIWMGLGQIILPADSFEIINTQIPEPNTIEYLDIGWDPQFFQPKADSAWEVAE